MRRITLSEPALRILAIENSPGGLFRRRRRRSRRLRFDADFEAAFTQFKHDALGAGVAGGGEFDGVGGDRFHLAFDFARFLQRRFLAALEFSKMDSFAH